MRLIDSHCHLPLVADDQRSVAEVVHDAHTQGVSHMLCVCVELESFEEVRQAALAHDNVFASLGVHPNADDGARDPTLDELLTFGSDPLVVAIGETGLDYFRSEGDLDWQRERFRRHIRAARELKKPLIIHTREAASDVIKILREERAQDVGGVMHCFTETLEMAEEALALGFYISFSGIISFKNANDLRDVAQKVPLNRLLQGPQGRIEMETALPLQR